MAAHRYIWTTMERVQPHGDSIRQDLEIEIQQLNERLAESKKNLALKDEECKRLRYEFTKDLKARENLVNDYRKRHEKEKQEMKTKLTREIAQRDQKLTEARRRFEEEEASKWKWKEKSDWHLDSFVNLRESFNTYLKRWAEEEQDLNTSLSRKDEELRVLREQLREKTARLALSFEKRLKQDQRRVENTVESNKPSDIEHDFRNFFDEERLEGCDDIEFVLSPSGENDVNVHYPRLACLILETAYEEVKEARDAACDLFQTVTSQLTEKAPKMCQELCRARKKSGASAQLQETFDLLPGSKNEGISADVLNGMMLSLKENSHVGDLNCFVEDVTESVREQWKKFTSETERSFLPTPSEDVLTRLGNYIKACIRLTWRMVTQVPPMQLEYKAMQFDNDLHKLARFQQRAEYFRGADQLSGQVIACYLWPALLEAGGRIIFPGEVMCERDPEDYVVISQPLTP